MGFDRALVVVTIAAFLKINHVDSAPSLEINSDYAKVAKNEKPTVTEPSVRKTTLGPSTNETMDVVEYEDFDDIEEDRAFKQVSAGESMVKLFTGLISLMGLLQGFKNFHHSANSSLGLNLQKPNFKNPNEPRKATVGERIQKIQERFLSSKPIKSNEKLNNQEEFPSLENYPPYNPFTANTAETYMKDNKKTSYEVYNSQNSIGHYNYKDEDHNSIDHYNHKVEVETIPSYSYEISYEPPKPVKQNHDTHSSDEMSWNDQNIRAVHQPWVSEMQPGPKPSFVDSYLPWSSKPQDKGKPQTNSFTDAQPPWKEKMPSGDFPTYQHSFKNPPPPPSPPDDFPKYEQSFKNPPPPPPPPDHHFEYEEMDHHDDHHAVEEDRVDKKPYSYYFLGRKLWYIPLLFSVYFIVYVGALVLKSVARHKIQFPEKVWDLHDHHIHSLHDHVKVRRHRNIDEVTETVENAIDKMKNKFM